MSAGAVDQSSFVPPFAPFSFPLSSVFWLSDSRTSHLPTGFALKVCNMIRLPTSSWCRQLVVGPE